MDVVEDIATVHKRRETRKHILQGSSFGGLVLFRDFSRIEIERDDFWLLDEQPIVWRWVRQTCLTVSTA